MVSLAELTRQGFINGDLSVLMSPRTVLTWAHNSSIFRNVNYAFKVSFLNRCDDIEKDFVKEIFQRCMGEDLESENPISV